MERVFEVTVHAAASVMHNMFLYVHSLIGLSAGLGQITLDIRCHINPAPPSWHSRSMSSSEGEGEGTLGGAGVGVGLPGNSPGMSERG